MLWRGKNKNKTQPETRPTDVLITPAHEATKCNTWSKKDSVNISVQLSRDSLPHSQLGKRTAREHEKCPIQLDPQQDES